MTNSIDVCFVALGDHTRRALFDQLTRGSYAVGELADRSSVSRPAVSQHLKILMTAQLIQCRKEGTRRVYSINQDGVKILKDYLDRIS